MSATKTSRRVGAGRKPSGPIKNKKAAFSTRITEATRNQLEAEAAMTGHSISQVAERLIGLGLQVRAEKDIDDPIRALSRLLGALAYNCSYIDEHNKQGDWTTSSFSFEAFVTSINSLMEQLKPDGNNEKPREMNGLPTVIDSKKLGEQAFATVWRMLQVSEPVGVQQLRGEQLDRGVRPFPEATLGLMSNASFAFDQITRSLKIRKR